MRLTSLTLHGFKSFGNRTTVEFAPGITAIVGPNGSGKSNVIDALKWASGGGRASEFRAGEKTDLIFHGASGKRSLGYAEVELELRGGQSKVTVFRSLHRDGTGRLRLNGKNARFLDIDEELAGSGLGKSGLAIIGQGEVSGVLMADPAKLLQYVAEAAGVARLAGRREQTEDRLATARTHLERLEDLMQELERQIGRLQEEAQGAKRHAELTRDSLRLRYTLAMLREASLRSEIGALREDKGKLEAEVAEARSELEAGRGELSASRQAQSESERAYREAMAQSEARRGDVRVAAARVENLEARSRDLELQRSAVGEELGSLERLEAPLEPDVDVARLEAAQAEAEAQLGIALEERSSAESEARTAREEHERLRNVAHAAAQQSAALESRREALHRELAEIERQAAELEERGRDGSELEQQEARAQELRDRHLRLGEELSALRGKLEEAQARHANALAEAQARGRAAERSRQAFEARRGYAQGPRTALSSGIRGIHGSVADLLRVPDEYLGAVGAALGRRMEYVVVDNAGTGQKVLDAVRKGGGFVTVLPLDLVDGRAVPLAERLRDEPGVIGMASDLIDADERFAPVARQLLGNTMIVRTMADAVAIARRERSRPRMVTLEGDIVESYGAMSGGKRQAQAGVLGAAAELEDAEAAAAEATGSARRAEAELTELQARARDLIEREAEGRRLLDEAAAVLSRLREEEAARRELLAEVARRHQRACDELEGMEAPLSHVDEERLEAAATALAECEAKLESCRERVEERQRELAERRQERLLAAERQQAFEAARAQYRRDLERREALEGRRRTLEQESERTAVELDRARQALEEARAAVPSDLEEKEQAYRLAAESLAALEERLTRLTEAQAARGEALERINVTLARREAAWELANEELAAFPGGIPTMDGSERALKAQLSDATAELEALGAVNHRAGLELEQEEARLASLREESEKAQLAIDELATTLEKLDNETNTRLEAGVTGLRDGFRKHVIELFGENAEADIEVEREEGRPVGLRIRLQPPGKQTRQLNLLSVGERTMGAMAFLFALMSGGGQQGLPIAVLDEVDAPLDEANIRRYCDFLTRLAQRGTQFILITHQKATFEVADVMWGVTTEQGVSRVFSIARSEAVAVG
ncbi:MAG TPA: chromosome segregation protein SMC [Trueperaceae bacterium]